MEYLTQWYDTLGLHMQIFEWIIFIIGYYIFIFTIYPKQRSYKWQNKSK